MAIGDLDIAQVDLAVEHGRDEGMARHVRVRPSDLYASSGVRATSNATYRMTAHAVTQLVSRIGSSPMPISRFGGPATRWRQRCRTILAPLAAHAQDPCFTEVSDMRADANSYTDTSRTTDLSVKLLSVGPWRDERPYPGAFVLIEKAEVGVWEFDSTLIRLMSSPI